MKIESQQLGCPLWLTVYTDHIAQYLINRPLHNANTTQYEMQHLPLISGWCDDNHLYKHN